jgi:glutaredoxin
MKPFIKLFFKTLRVILAPFVVLWELLTRPKGVVRVPALQETVDRQCLSLALYQYRTCPFCIKVRQEMRRLSLPVARMYVQKDGKNRDDLTRGGGQTKVPCLRITDEAGNSQWMYDSKEIIAYLRSRFAAQ